MFKIPLKENTFATNCKKCNYTCQYPCTISHKVGRYFSHAMTMLGFCSVCEGKCYWTDHD